MANIVGLIVGDILYELIGGFTFLMSAGLIYLVFRFLARARD